MESIDVSMNEKQLVLTLTGQITALSAQALLKEIDLGFDYYQFPEITVCLDSPGGEYRPMGVLIDSFNARRLNRHPIHVQATRVCASAAALVLAHGKWGTRTVEPDTHLQFHWARATFQVGQVLTSDVAASLARGLVTVDQKTLERLVASMCQGAGGESELVGTMSLRLQSLLDQWDSTARVLYRDADPEPARQCTWLKDLQRLTKRLAQQLEPNRQTAVIVSFLKSRFEQDTVMDLREAFALGLIDVVRGVLPLQPRVESARNDAPKQRRVVLDSVDSQEDAVEREVMLSNQK